MDDVKEGNLEVRAEEGEVVGEFVPRTGGMVIDREMMIQTDVLYKTLAQ